MRIKHTLKPSRRTIFGTSFLLWVTASVSAAPSLNRNVSDVTNKVDGFKRFCSEVSDQFRPLRCPENIDRITARLTASNLDPLERKHLRMYRVLERTALAETFARRGKPNDALGEIAKAFQDLEGISPKGSAIYPRIRAMGLYPALIEARIALNDAAGLEEASTAMREFAAYVDSASSPALIGASEYEAGYEKTLRRTYLANKMRGETLLADYYKKQYASSQGEARVQARNQWMSALFGGVIWCRHIRMPSSWVPISS